MVYKKCLQHSGCNTDEPHLVTRKQMLVPENKSHLLVSEVVMKNLNSNSPLVLWLLFYWIFAVVVLGLGLGCVVARLALRLTSY